MYRTFRSVILIMYALLQLAYCVSLQSYLLPFLRHEMPRNHRCLMLSRHVTSLLVLDNVMLTNVTVTVLEVSEM